MRARILVVGLCLCLVAAAGFASDVNKAELRGTVLRPSDVPPKPGGFFLYVGAPGHPAQQIVVACELGNYPTCDAIPDHTCLRVTGWVGFAVVFVTSLREDTGCAPVP